MHNSINIFPKGNHFCRGPGTPAKIVRNGMPVESLSERIADGDRIEIEGAVDGVDAAALLADVVRVEPFRVFVNSGPVEVTPRLLTGGVAVDAGTLETAALYDRV